MGSHRRTSFVDALTCHDHYHWRSFARFELSGRSRFPLRLVLLVMLVLGLALSATTPAQAATGSPDLIPVAPRNADEEFYNVVARTFTETSCEVVEGAVPSAGTFRLLQFHTIVANIGTADLKIGNPATHPEWFDYSACHDHYHWRSFARFEVMDNAGTTVMAVGHKQGFCLEDNFVYDSGIARSSRPRYTDCDLKQGIQRGWADIYVAGLPGQWVVIGTRNPDGTWDTLPAGGYRLRTTINFADPFLPDSDPWNNTMDRFVFIPAV